MGGGGERRAVGKTGLYSLPYIPTRSAAPQDRSPGPLGARHAPRQILLTLRVRQCGKRVITLSSSGIRLLCQDSQTESQSAP